MNTTCRCCSCRSSHHSVKPSLPAATRMGHRGLPSIQIDAIRCFRGPAVYNAMRDLRVPRLTALTAAFCVSEAQRSRRSAHTCIPGRPGKVACRTDGVVPCQHSDYCDKGPRIPVSPRSQAGRSQSPSVFGLDPTCGQAESLR
jgi:hypothetical protein